jgi:hypothetical protein
VESCKEFFIRREFEKKIKPLTKIRQRLRVTNLSGCPRFGGYVTNYANGF